MSQGCPGHHGTVSPSATCTGIWAAPNTESWNYGLGWVGVDLRDQHPTLPWAKKHLDKALRDKGEFGGVQGWELDSDSLSSQECSRIPCGFPGFTCSSPANIPCFPGSRIPPPAPRGSPPVSTGGRRTPLGREKTGNSNPSQPPSGNPPLASQIPPGFRRFPPNKERILGVKKWKEVDLEGRKSPTRPQDLTPSRN